MEGKISTKLLRSLEKNLEREKKKTEKQINDLKKGDPFSDPDHAIDNAAVDTDVREQLGHESVEAQVKELERRLNDINRALKKIGKGRYGRCERCRKPISTSRLKLLPEARYCIQCERKIYG